MDPALVPIWLEQLADTSEAEGDLSGAKTLRAAVRLLRARLDREITRRVIVTLCPTCGAARGKR